MIDILLLCIFGYLIGSIPFGLVLTSLFGLGDLRKIGSGNIGATNVLRTGNKGLALATLLLDGAKGALVVGWAFAYHHGGVVEAGFCAFLGHLFPVWLGFKGGKGVATALGLTLALSWPAGLIGCATWALVAAIVRISSVAGLASFAVAPLTMDYFAGWHAGLFALVVAGFGFWTHRANIARLRLGTEPRIGKAAKPVNG